MGENVSSISKIDEIMARLTAEGKLVEVAKEPIDAEREYNWLPAALFAPDDKQIYGPGGRRLPANPEEYHLILDQLTPYEQEAVIKFYQLVLELLLKGNFDQKDGSDYDLQP